MSRLWIRCLVSALLLGIAVPVYFSVYLVLLFLWDHPHGNDVLFAYAVSAVFIVILLLTNFFAIGFVFRDLPRLRRALVSIVIVPVAFYVLWLFLLPSQSSYRHCDVYTKDMNGGVHAFEGKNYRIELCGIDGYTGVSDSGSDDAVHLKVFAMDGELLVERFYTPLSGMSSAMQLKYGDDFLMYRYETAGINQEAKITMPPSNWERIRARLPRIWP